MVAPFESPVVVLRSVNYAEADRVVTLFGRACGKVSAMARGARKSQRRFAGLAPGVLGLARLHERVGAELCTLESFVACGGARGLHDGDLARVAHTGYVLELCERLCAPRAPEPRVYDYLVEMLGELERAGPSAMRLRVFELGLLDRLGLAPVFERCVLCGRTDLDVIPVDFDPGVGGIVCRSCGARRAMQSKVRAALVQLAQTSVGNATKIVLDAAVAAACRDVTLSLVQEHAHAPLRTLTFVAKLGAG